MKCNYIKGSEYFIDSKITEEVFFFIRGLGICFSNRFSKFFH